MVKYRYMQETPKGLGLPPAANLPAFAFIRREGSQETYLQWTICRKPIRLCRGSMRCARDWGSPETTRDRRNVAPGPTFVKT